MNIREIVELAPLIPMLTIADLDHAVPLARALSAGGLKVLEVSVRTPVALAAIDAMRKAVPIYLALPTVVSVGGSWVAPHALMAAGDWTGIEKLARDAASLRVPRSLRA